MGVPLAPFDSVKLRSGPSGRAFRSIAYADPRHTLAFGTTHAMAKRRSRELDTEIDELTNSLKEVATGLEMPTEVVRVLTIHQKQIHKRSWLFDWHGELAQPKREVYKLTTRAEPDKIQGLICIEDLGDHVFAHLLESAAHNRGAKKRFHGVAGNLLAFAGQLSFDKGHAGFVSFVSKHALTEHYISTLGAKVLRGNRMYLDTQASRALVDHYFKTN